EDGIRDFHVTGVQTCALPILKKPLFEETQSILRAAKRLYDSQNYFVAGLVIFFSVVVPFIKAMLLLAIFAIKSAATRYRIYLFRSEERRVGKEWRRGGLRGSG